MLAGSETAALVYGGSRWIVPSSGDKTQAQIFGRRTMSSFHESPGTRAATPCGSQAGREWESGWRGKPLKFDSENLSLGLGSATVMY